MNRLLFLLGTVPLVLAACVDEPGLDDGDGDGGDVDGGASTDGGLDADPTTPETTLPVVPAALSNQVPARFELASDRAGTFRCALDGGAGMDCTSPYLIPVADGPHTLAVIAISTAGIPDPTPARHTWTVDTAAPDTSFVQAPAALDNSVTVRFELAATEASTYTCALDAGAAVACTSPHVITGLADGDHRLAVVATDAAGNVEPVAAVHAWTLDSTAPDTQIETGPTGAVSTTAARFTFASPDAGAGATFECALDGAAFAACTSPRALTNLPLGAHAFEVRVRDATGNVNPTPARRQWTVDTIVPLATIAAPVSPTSDNTPTFTFSLFDAPTSVQCRFDSDPFAPCTSPYTPATPLADGEHTFEVRVADAAGNTSTASRSITIDTAAPDTQIDSGPIGPFASRNATFTFSSPDAGAGATFQCALDGGPWATCTSPRALTNLPLGARSFQVRVRDATGNLDPTPAQRAWTIDITTPSATIAAPVSPTGDSTPTFTFTLFDAPTSVQCRFDSDPFAPCTSPHTPASPLADGDHTFEVRVADDAGNTSTASRPFTIDTVAPVVTIAAPASPTNDTTPTFTFTIAGGASAVACRLGAAAFAPCVSPYTPGPLSDGVRTVEVRATDAAGNVGAATSAITIDTVAPTVTILTGPGEGELINTRTPTWTFTTAGDAISFECGIDAAPLVPCTSATSWTQWPPMGDGERGLKIRVRDAAGNAFVLWRHFRLDATPPSVWMTGISNGDVIRDNTPTFNVGNQHGASWMVCRLDAAPFGPCTTPTTLQAPVLADGPHVAEVRAGDDAGNVVTVSRHFTVDTVAPTLEFTGGPTAPVQGSVARFTWVTSATWVQCATYPVSQAPPTTGWVACTSPRDQAVPAFTGPSATFRFHVRARDGAGNLTETTADFTAEHLP